MIKKFKPTLSFKSSILCFYTIFTQKPGVPAPIRQMRIDTSLFYHLVIIDGLSKAVAAPWDFKGCILVLSVNQFGHFTLIYDKMFTRPSSAVGNVSGYRCVPDCHSRGREFDPGPVPYFRGD